MNADSKREVAGPVVPVDVVAPEAIDSLVAAEVVAGIVETRMPRFFAGEAQSDRTGAVLALGMNAKWYLKPAGVDGFAEISEQLAGRWISVNLA